MTPSRFQECLTLLGWQKSHLAALLGCSESLVRQMATGKVKVREDVSIWIETLVHFHAVFPAPSWKKRNTGKPQIKD